MVNVLDACYVKGLAAGLAERGIIKVSSELELDALAYATAERLATQEMPKLASLGTKEDTVRFIADVLIKVAAETGALVTGDKPSQKNTLENAAKEQPGSMAAMEQNERPQGKYHEGAGETTLDTSKGEVGKEEKQATLRSVLDILNSQTPMDAFNKAAMSDGNLVDGMTPSHENTLERAAVEQPGSLAAMEAVNRPSGEHTVGAGNTELPDAGRVGKEMPHPAGTPGRPATGAATNSAVEETQKAAYVQMFKQAAEQLTPYLPRYMPTDLKVATVQEAMSMPPEAVPEYLDAVLAQTGGSMGCPPACPGCPLCAGAEPDGDEKEASANTGHADLWEELKRFV